MVKFEKYTLDNGLRLVVHTDKSTPMVAVCVSYDVGTRDENPERTGFAHLFEHLMFGGSLHATNFDDHIQNAGGENNAFTNQDMTVYYEIVPYKNIDTALWLEADRMQNLLLNQKALEVQRKVVVEEFHETCLEEPYGDVWHHLSPLAYPKHPYQVPTIGAKVEHIAEANLDDVKGFFDKFYCPNNAVISICGNIDAVDALEKVKHWFGDIQVGQTPTRPLFDAQAPQTPQKIHIKADVPLDAIYIAFPAAPRDSHNFYTEDLLSDILGEGDTARLYQRLVKKEQIFSEIDAYITGTLDRGLFIIEGKLNEETTFEQAEKAIWQELEQLATTAIDANELQKLQNRIEHNLAFSEMSNMNKAISLGYYELLGDAGGINLEGQRYQAVTAQAIQERAARIFQISHSTTVYYKSTD